MALMTDQQIDELVRARRAEHPDENPVDVWRALRAAGHEGFQSFQIFEAYEGIQPVPTLDTVEDAHAVLKQLADRFEWVSVFWDRGWGDHGERTEISIIVDGDGQMPIVRLTNDVYRGLLDQQIIGPNSLITYKARKNHDYQPVK